MVVTNWGPGYADEVTITKLSWVPKPGQSMPGGVDSMHKVGRLQPGQGFALLVDAAEEIDNDQPLKKSNASEICMTFTYADLSGRPFTRQACVGSIPPVFDLTP